MKFELWLPVKPLKVSQPFGATGNLQYYKDNGVNFIGHSGIDLIAYHGQPVYASHDGTAYVQTDVNQGHGVIVISNETYDYKGEQVYFKSVYWHFKSEAVVNGQKVSVGDLLGYADSTGLSTGDHVHWGLKPVRLRAGYSNNAQDAADISGYENVEQTNGYFGAIDPNPYLNGFYAEDSKKVIGLFQGIINLLKGFLNNAR